MPQLPYHTLSTDFFPTINLAVHKPKLTIQKDIYPTQRPHPQHLPSLHCIDSNNNTGSTPTSPQHVHSSLPPIPPSAKNKTLKSTSTPLTSTQTPVLPSIYHSNLPPPLIRISPKQRTHPDHPTLHLATVIRTCVCQRRFSLPESLHMYPDSCVLLTFILVASHLTYICTSAVRIMEIHRV